MADNTQRFTTGIEAYHAFRPRYPEAVLVFLAKRISAVADAGILADVGSGSGIFSLQIRACLPDGIEIVGVEPSEAMRSQAQKGAGAGVRFMEGKAERLPLADGSLLAVTAATAAHWFDRPTFYREAARVLRPAGILAIVEYVRDSENSPAARAMLDFLDREGEPRVYARPDYFAELGALQDFGDPDMFELSVTFRFTKAEFAGLALSSSHAKLAIQRLGRSEAEKRLLNLGQTLAGEDGRIPFGYRFQCQTVSRSRQEKG